MKPLLAALLVFAADGGPRLELHGWRDGGWPDLMFQTPPPKPPSKIVVNSWTQSIYEKPFPGGYQILLIPWTRADVIDAFIYPTSDLSDRLAYSWTVYVGGKVQITGYATSRGGAEAAIMTYVGPLIQARNAKYSRPKE